MEAAQVDHERRPGAAISIIAAATALLALAFGIRAVVGMFISPLNSATGLGFAAISFALALSQLASGLAQPVCGAIADRHGPARVVFAGGLLLAAGTALIPFSTSVMSLAFVFCLMAVAYAAVGSTPTLLSTVTCRVPTSWRGLATGVVSSGGALGQLVLAPVTQVGIAAAGWMSALFGLALLSLAALPLSRVFARDRSNKPAQEEKTSMPGTRAALRAAFTTPDYWLICAGFFACGFHVSFLLAHMPGAIVVCGVSASVTGIWLGVLGLSNIAGSIVAGLALGRYPMTRILVVLYALRAAGVGLFLIAPKTEAVLLGFGVWMGFTYMATLPPTSGLVGKLFGMAHLGSLFGVVMLVHQVGSFLGIWLGGVAMETSGNYDWMWRLDIVLAIMAALIHLLIRERPPARTTRATGALGTAAA